MALGGGEQGISICLNLIEHEYCMSASMKQEHMAWGVQVPGNIRRAEHFCAFLKRLVEHLKGRISVQIVEQESCTTFLATLQETMAVDGAPAPFPNHQCCLVGCSSPLLVPVFK